MNNPVILYTAGGIWGFLLLANLIVFALTKLKPNKNYHDLVLRIKSWWAMVAVFTLAMFTSRNLSLCFLGLISFLALKEFF